MLVDRTTDNTFRISGSYPVLFSTAEDVFRREGGKIQSSSLQDGKIRATWRYGLNVNGLEVAAIFISKPDRDFIEVTTEGRFRNAMDTTGVARSKAAAMSKALEDALTPLAGAAAVEQAPPITPPPVQQKLRNLDKSKAGALALLIGGVGAHKFYLGAWGWGCVYVASIFIVPYISLLLGFIEGIRLFSMSPEDFDRRWNLQPVGPFTVRF